MAFVAVSILFKTHFHVFPPTPTTFFSTPTPIGTRIFHLEHQPQVETIFVGWNFKLTVLFCEYKFFQLKTPVFRLYIFNSCT